MALEFAMSANELRDEFQALAPGDSLVYFIGHLAMVIELDGALDDLRLAALELGEREDQPLQVYGRAWNPKTRHKLGKGIAVLTQKRLEMGRYEYRIQKRVVAKP